MRHPVAVIGICLAFMAFVPMREPVDGAPPFSEVEALKVRTLNLEVTHVNDLYLLAQAAKEKADTAAATAQEHMASLKAELEHARPGWTIDMASGQWTQTPAKK